MACNDLLVGWKSKSKTALGKRAVTFRKHEGYKDLPLNLPCGKCYGCRLNKSREWALRCAHESEMHTENSFITLTYDEKSLPTIGQLPTLQPNDFVNFMKRLRKNSGKILFFHCGEYGELDGRPHHHALLFGRSFPDQYYWRKSGDYNLYRSPELEKLWTYGHSEIGEVSFESAGYIARYTLKMKDNLREGQVKEYLTMSRRPGIGKTWLQKYMSDVYPSDQVVTRYGIYKPPRYYDKQLGEQQQLQLQTTRQAKLTDEQRSGARNMAREQILKSRANLRRRNL